VEGLSVTGGWVRAHGVKDLPAANRVAIAKRPGQRGAEVEHAFGGLEQCLRYRGGLIELEPELGLTIGQPKAPPPERLVIDSPVSNASDSRATSGGDRSKPRRWADR
jgi:hypothetical protein